MWYPTKLKQPAFPRDVEEVIYEIPQVKEVAVTAVAGHPFAFVIAGKDAPTPNAVSRVNARLNRAASSPSAAAGMSSTVIFMRQAMSTPTA